MALFRCQTITTNTLISFLTKKELEQEEKYSKNDQA